MDSIRSSLTIKLSKIFSRLKSSALFRDSFWAIFGNVIGKGLSLIAGVFVARFLGSDLYGEYGIVKDTMVMIAIFSSFGLGYTATKFIAEDPKKSQMVHRVCMYITFVFSAFIAILLFILSDYVAMWIEAVHLNKILRWSSIAIIFNAINTTQIGELAGFKLYKAIALNSTIVGVITFIITIPLSYFFHLEGAVISLIISYACNCVLNYVVLRKQLAMYSSEKSSAGASVKKILGFSLPVAMQESLFSITSWCGTWLLIKYAGYDQLGIYSVAAQWGSVVLYIPGTLRNVALSHLSTTNNDMQANNKVLRLLLKVNFVSTFLPFLAVAVLSNWICSWYGDTYVGLQSILIVVTFSSIISSLANVLTQELMALNKNWFLFGSRFIRDLSSLFMAFGLISIFQHGALSFAIAMLMSQIIYFVLLSIISNKE